MRTRVKICGIRRQSDASHALALGADALGFVFYSGSKRYIAPDQACHIIKQMSALSSAVALFVNEDASVVKDIIAQTGVQLLQFHGDEPPEYCGQFDIPYMKALRVGRVEGGLYGAALEDTIASYSDASAILLDTYSSRGRGGTGETFDWQLLPETSRPIILAGGLNADNVAQAISEHRPYAVDISGGVETAPGIKDTDKMRAFFSAVNETDIAVYAQSH